MQGLFSAEPHRGRVGRDNEARDVGLERPEKIETTRIHQVEHSDVRRIAR
jgi:hypothetical protein